MPISQRNELPESLPQIKPDPKNQCEGMNLAVAERRQYAGESNRIKNYLYRRSSKVLNLFRTMALLNCCPLALFLRMIFFNYDKGAGLSERKGFALNAYYRDKYA
jgi:hypothetical protein